MVSFTAVGEGGRKGGHEVGEGTRLLGHNMHATSVNSMLQGEGTVGNWQTTILAGSQAGACHCFFCLINETAV